MTRPSLLPLVVAAGFVALIALLVGGICQPLTPGRDEGIGAPAGGRAAGPAAAELLVVATIPVT